MTIILYFDEARVEEARALMLAARADEHKIIWAAGYAFKPMDIEPVDEVWTLGEFPVVIKTYADAGIPVVSKDGAKPSEPEETKAETEEPAAPAEETPVSEPEEKPTRRFRRQSSADREIE